MRAPLVRRRLHVSRGLPTLVQVMVAVMMGLKRFANGEIEDAQTSRLPVVGLPC